MPIDPQAFIHAHEYLGIPRGKRVCAVPEQKATSGTEDDAAGHDAYHDADAFAGEGDAPDRPGGEPDYYAALGVRPGAAPDDVRRAYHRLAMLWHPDRFMDAPPALRERAERRARALNAAYHILGDPTRRAAYDLRAPALRHASRHASYHAPAGAFAARWHGGDVGDAGDAGPTTSGADGTGIFVGGLVAIIALVFIGSALGRGYVTPGGYVALGIGIVLAGVAFWCATQGALLARLASEMLAGASQPPASTTHAPHPPYAPRPAQQPADADPAHPAPHGDAAPPAHMEDATDDPDDAADAAFEQVVEEAVAGIPAAFRSYMDNVVVRVKRNPSPQEIARLSEREEGLLLGLYEGVDLTRQGMAGAPLPEVITIFRRPIEHYCHHDPTRFREQIRRTVLHELAHHFGIDHDAMPDWIR